MRRRDHSAWQAASADGDRPRSRGARARRATSGLTLIEIMVVIVVVALAATGVSIGLGALTRTNLRSACIKLMGASRYAYHRALTQGTTVRLTLDFEKDTFTLSEAHGRVTLARSDAPLRQKALRDDEDEVQDPGAGVDPWAAARQRIEQPDALALPPSPFAAITSPSGAVISRFVEHPVGDNVELRKVVVAHEAEPREDGKVDLFFFPSGMTQHAVIQLKDSNDVVFSVEIHPLTGRGTVHSVPFEPEVLMDDPTERDENASQLEDR